MGGPPHPLPQNDKQITAHLQGPGPDSERFALPPNSRAWEPTLDGAKHRSRRRGRHGAHWWLGASRDPCWGPGCSTSSPGGWPQFTYQAPIIWYTFTCKKSTSVRSKLATAPLSAQDLPGTVVSSLLKPHVTILPATPLSHTPHGSGTNLTCWVVFGLTQCQCLS